MEAYLQAPSFALGGLMVAMRVMVPRRTSQICTTPDTWAVATIQSMLELVPLLWVDPPVVLSPSPEMIWELECVEVNRGIVISAVTRPVHTQGLGPGLRLLVVECFSDI